MLLKVRFYGLILFISLSLTLYAFLRAKATKGKIGRYLILTILTGNLLCIKIQLWHKFSLMNFDN